MFKKNPKKDDKYYIHTRKAHENEMAEDYANSQFSDIAGGIPYIQPGTEEFTNIFNEITN